MAAAIDELPERKHLPHGIPPWVSQGAKHFITINCKKRGDATLIQEQNADKLLESAMFYEHEGKWYIWLLLLMPDHIHMIATMDLSRGIQKILSSWKGYQKRTLGIEWQPDFFEHRLRTEQEFLEKALYIRMNPVRKGLAENPADWPYLLDRSVLSRDS